MTLSEEARDRLADIVRLQPTKNRELQERWGLESGSEVHGYLENNLKEYYYRDDNSLIRATSEAAELVGVDPGVEADDGDGDGDGEVPSVIRVPALEAAVFEHVAGPDERTESVVSVLHTIRAATDLDPEVDAVRRALQSLRRKGVVEIEYRAVPTFRRSVDHVRVEIIDDGDGTGEDDAGEDDGDRTGEDGSEIDALLDDLEDVERQSTGTND